VPFPHLQRACAPFEVLDACHRKTLDQLRDLQSLLGQVAAHGLDDKAQQLARQAHLYFATTALNHHLDEERHVFPSLLKNKDEAFLSLVKRLQEEHVILEGYCLQLVPQLDAMARGYRLHDVPAMQRSVDAFTVLSRQHIALEESLIYPQSRASLNQGDLSDMAREMTLRRASNADQDDPDDEDAYDDA